MQGADIIITPVILILSTNGWQAVRPNNELD
jgi:hypothetical protein